MAVTADADAMDRCIAACVNDGMKLQFALKKSKILVAARVNERSAALGSCTSVCVEIVVKLITQ